MYTRAPSSLTTVSPAIRACIETFKLNPPKTRVDIISSPAAAATILELAAALPETGCQAHTIFTIPTTTVDVQSYSWGEHLDHHTTNTTPLSITILDSRDAPIYSMPNLRMPLALRGTGEAGAATPALLNDLAAS
jgi:hypothetical protein